MIYNAALNILLQEEMQKSVKTQVVQPYKTTTCLNKSTTYLPKPTRYKKTKKLIFFFNCKSRTNKKTYLSRSKWEL